MIKKKSDTKDRKPMSIKRLAQLLVGFLLISSACMGIYIWHWESRPHVLTVEPLLIDGNIVIFIQTPDNHTIIVDGGKTDAVVRAITARLPFYRRDIDAIVLTKPDDGHVAGLISVLDRYHVGQVVESDTSFGSTTATTSQTYLAFEKAILDKKIEHTKVKAGDIVPISPALHIDLRVISPDPTFKYTKTNTPILAAILQYGRTSFLISDMTKTEQKSLASSTLPQHVVLISQHAGSSGSQYEGFYEQIRPDYIVISKKPSKVAAAGTDVSAATKATIATTTKTGKPKKIPKPPFSIYDATSTKIMNLEEKPDRLKFISDGEAVTLDTAR